MTLQIYILSPAEAALLHIFQHFNVKLQIVHSVKGGRVHREDWVVLLGSAAVV